MNIQPSFLRAGLRLVADVWEHPANRNARMAAVARLVAWQARKRILPRATIIPFHGKRLKCWPDSTSTSAALYFGGYADWWETKFVLAYLREGDGFIDIGANAGIYSLLASDRVGPAGLVDAFEPAGRMANRIEEQAELNGLPNLRVHRIAIADRCGVAQFGYSTTDAMAHVKRDGEQGDSVEVNCTTLDAFRGYRSYALGKMDIEGAEPLALEGARTRLAQCNPPVWLLELAGYSNLYGYSSDEVIERLDQAGYDCAIYDPAANKLRWTTAPWESGVQNVLAVARAHRAAVEARIASSAT